MSVELKFIEESPMAGRERTVRAEMTVGREGCDFVLSDPEVSRKHATFHELEGGLAVEDHGSTNGTYINDERVQGTRSLTAGDMLRFGHTSWRLEGAPQAAADATSLAPGAAVTAARPVPGPPPPAAAPAPPAAPPAAAAPPEPQPVAAAAAPAAPAVAHGDVPRPDAAPPSAIRRALPAQTATPAFLPTGQGRPGGGSAATRVEATLLCYAVVIAAAVGVVIYEISL